MSGVGVRPGKKRGEKDERVGEEARKRSRRPGRDEQAPPAPSSLAGTLAAQAALALPSSSCQISSGGEHAGHVGSGREETSLRDAESIQKYMKASPPPPHPTPPTNHSSPLNTRLLTVTASASPVVSESCGLVQTEPLAHSCTHPGVAPPRTQALQSGSEQEPTSSH